MRKRQINAGGIKVLVTTDERDVIRDIAPIFRKFSGQPFGNLELWLRSNFDKVVIYELGN